MTLQKLKQNRKKQNKERMKELENVLFEDIVFHFNALGKSLSIFSKPRDYFVSWDYVGKKACTLGHGRQILPLAFGRVFHLISE